MLFETGKDRGYMSRRNRGVRHLFANDLLAPSAWGVVSNDATWDKAVNCYLGDQLDEAWRLVDDAGTGDGGYFLEFSRILDAEAATGQRSEITRLSPTAELECVADDAGRDPAELGAIVLAEIGAAEKALCEVRTTPTLVTLLLRDAFIPTAMLEAGYFVAKEPYGKICIPGAALDDPAEFAYTVRRGVCYQVLYGLTEGRASRWFMEAAVAAVDPPKDEVAAAALGADPRNRLSPEDLEHTFQSEIRDEPLESRIACEQAHGIGRFLLRDGVRKLIECAKAHTSPEPMDSLRKGAPFATEGPVRAVYGMDLAELFARS